MDNQQRRAELEHHLSAASAAHAEYEATVLRGEYDTAWADWYARFMLEHGWNSLFSRVWTESELARALDEANAAHRANAPGRPWHEFYAERFAEA